MENNITLTPKVFTVVPAKVDFNFDELKLFAQTISDQYKDLIFDETQVQDAKASAAELRKIVKSIGNFKKKIKVELSVDIVEFENKCKEIEKVFSDSIEFIAYQCDEFEKKRMSDKQAKIELEISKLLTKHSMNNLSIEIQQKWLLTTTTMKSVKEDILALILVEKAKQEQHLRNIQLLEDTVSSLNTSRSLSIPLDASRYIPFLEIKNVIEIASMITSDADAQLDAENKIKLSLESDQANSSTLEKEHVATVDKHVDSRQLKAVLEFNTTADKMVLLREFLVANNIDYTKISAEFI